MLSSSEHATLHQTTHTLTNQITYHKFTEDYKEHIYIEKT